MARTRKRADDLPPENGFVVDHYDAGHRFILPPSHPGSPYRAGGGRTMVVDSVLEASELHHPCATASSKSA